MQNDKVDPRVYAAERRFRAAQARSAATGGLTTKGGGTALEAEYASSALILMQAGQLPKLKGKYRYGG